MPSSPKASSSSFSATREQLARRLAHVEGQVRGVQRMIDDDRPCVEILTQIAAAQAALDKVALALLDDHVRGTLAEGDRERAAGEALDAVARLLRAG